MELNDKVLMITFVNGISIPVEGSFKNFGDVIQGTTFVRFIHATLGDSICINISQIMNVREVARKDLQVGPNKVIMPGGGRLN